MRQAVSFPHSVYFLVLAAAVSLCSGCSLVGANVVPAWPEWREWRPVVIEDRHGRMVKYRLPPVVMVPEEALPVAVVSWAEEHGWDRARQDGKVPLSVLSLPVALDAMELQDEIRAARYAGGHDDSP